MTDHPPRSGDARKALESDAVDATEATRQRLAQLAARRPRPTRVAGSSAPGGTPGVTVPIEPARSRQKPRHPALAARILTAGLSTALMLSIITDLGANAAPPLDTASLLDSSTVQITPAPATVIVASPTASEPSVAVTELSGQPIQLTAAPALRPVDAAPRQQPAPVVKTHGSR